MRYINKKIQTIPYVLNYIKETIHDEVSPFEMISNAPWYIRFIAKGGYCVYKDTIYVPTFHLELVQSPHEEDRTLGTAKMLPGVMFLHDYKHVSLFKAIQFMYSLSYQTHYFLYEFLILKAASSRFEELVTIGFLTSRTDWFKPVQSKEVEQHLSNILAISSR